MTSCAGSEPPLRTGDLMLVTGRRQSGITPPAVGVNHRPATAI